jgi:predicted PurR-regulated permease PerM
VRTEPTESLKIPFYGKVTILLVGLIALVAILVIAKSIIIPIIFAIIIAIVLHPVVKFLTRIKINRVVAIAITLLLTFLLIFGFINVFIGQASRFSESWPVLVDKFTLILNQSISDISSSLEINPQKIHAWITKTQGELINTSTAALGQTLVILGNWLVVLFLLPVYIFLILFYQPILLEFIHRFFGTEHKAQVSEIVSQVKRVIQSYLIGLLLEAIIVAILDSAALLILGIDYAVILGIIGALLNVIPYLGGLVAVALPIMVALVTKSSPWYMVYIMAAYYFIQLIDNNYIVPYIVASKVKINALFSIIVVLAGNAMWGIPGMFLSIPLLAIVKLICDHIEPLKPWGFLLGDTMPQLIKIKTIFKKKNT